MSKQSKPLSGAMTIVTLVLGMVALSIGAVYLVYRFLNDRAYYRKWKEYDDCGIA